jgi:hypothetical protein
MLWVSRISTTVLVALTLFLALMFAALSVGAWVGLVLAARLEERLQAEAGIDSGVVPLVTLFGVVAATLAALALLGWTLRSAKRRGVYERLWSRIRRLPSGLTEL